MVRLCRGFEGSEGSGSGFRIQVLNLGWKAEDGQGAVDAGHRGCCRALNVVVEHLSSPSIPFYRLYDYCTIHLQSPEFRLTWAHRTARHCTPSREELSIVEDLPVP